VIEKTYDGTTAATLGSNNYSLTGVISGDTVTLIDPTGAAYDTKNVGTGKTVTFTGLALSGADAGNYTVPVSASAPVGVIDALAITASLTGVVDKTYDGTTAATLGSGDYQLTGVIGGDTVALAAGAGTYDTRNVGTGKTVTFSGLNLTGADAMDYTVNTTASAAIGQIDPLALTASLIGAVSKTYDGTVAATLTAANYSLTGVVSGDAASLNDPTTGTYDTSAIGTGKTVTVTGVNLTGADASNYLVPTTLTGPVGVITAAPTIYNPIIPTITPKPELTQTDTTPAGPDNGGGTGGSGGLGGDGATPGTGTGDAVGPASDFSVPVTDTLGGDGSPDQPGVGPDLSLPGGPANSRTQTASVFPVGTEGRGPHTGIDTSPVTGAGNRDLWSGVDESGQACALGGNAAGACQSGPAPSK